MQATQIVRRRGRAISRLRRPRSDQQPAHGDTILELLWHRAIVPLWRAFTPNATQVGTLVTAVAAIGALIFTGLSVRATQEGQYTDRYTKAVEQLGSQQIDVRLGAIYALERLARDSTRDSSTIAEVLSAFVRNRAPSLKDCKTPPAGSPRQHLATDIKAAITVRQRMRTTETSLPGVDLSQACFAGMALSGLSLAGADLRFADLTGADLSNTDLTGADLSGAILKDTYGLPR
jgi:hypothetical protein